MHQEYNGLPESLTYTLQELAKQTYLNSTPIRVCLSGAFSVGKSSLLNMLLEQRLLPVALEECTTLPTFLEYGTEEGYSLTAQGQTRPISQEQLSEYILKAPHGAQFATATLTQPWLKNIEIVDLPGLGSISQDNKDYSRLQMEQADIIIYLLAPRGPSQEDLDSLAMLHIYGKTVLVGVGRWDEVETSASQGEVMPDLKKWQANILYKTGISSDLVPMSKYGEGRERILHFLQTSSFELLDIRKQRFIALATPVLQSALHDNAQALQAVQAHTEDVVRARHLALQEESNALLLAKEKLFQEKDNEQECTLHAFSEKIQTVQSSFKSSLEQEKKTLTGADNFEAFLLKGEQLLRQSLDNLAQYASYLSEKYGKTFTSPELEQLHLQVPVMEPVAVTDFIDTGRVDFARQRLQELCEHLKTSSHADSIEMQEKIALLSQDIFQLQSQYSALTTQPLPRIEVKTENSATGAIVGRTLGEIADFALIFFAPTLLANKGVTVAGKAAAVASKTSKVAAAARGALKLHNAAKTGNLTTHLPGIADKLQVFDMITLGYWGEQLGRAFDGGAQSQWIVDPEVKQVQQERLRLVEADITTRRQELYSLENAVSASRVQSKQYQEEKLRLEQELAQMENEAKRERQRLENEYVAQQLSNLTYVAEKALSHWQGNLNAQSKSMLELLASSMKQWWDLHIDDALAQRSQAVAKLNALLDAAPQEKRAQEEKIAAEHNAITEVLRQIVYTK